MHAAVLNSELGISAPARWAKALLHRRAAAEAGGKAMLEKERSTTPTIPYAQTFRATAAPCPAPLPEYGLLLRLPSLPVSGVVGVGNGML